MAKHPKTRKTRSAAADRPRTTPPPAGMPDSRRDRLRELRRVAAATLVLVALTVAVYAPVVHAGYIWDDDAYVTGNRLLGSAAGLRDMWLRLGSTTIYAPAFFTTLWIEHQLWGLRPLGYHLVNLAFHIAGALLLWRFWRRVALPGAWLAAALFAVHPVMVESVAWVAELKNVQSGFFCLLFLLAWLRFDPLDGSPRPHPAARRRWYGLALLAFALALLTKPVAVSVPPVLLVLVWWKRGRIARHDLAAVAAPMAMGLAAALLAVYVEHRYGVATGAGFEMPLVERILVAGRALWFYAAKLAWPAGLLSIYPRWTVAAGAWWQYLYPLGALAVVALLWRWRERVGRGPLAAVLAFGLLVGPLTGIFNVAYHAYSFVADHFQYHAAPALLALVAAGAARLRARRAAALRRAIDAACTLAILGFAWLAARYVPTFRDEKTRCLYTAERNPGAWSAMYNLGVALKAEGKAQEALRWYQRALEVTPNNPEALNNAGVALMTLGDAPRAIERYRQALRIWPNYALAHNNLATALASQGDREAAIREYSAALRIKPDYVEARANLAQLLAAAGRVDDALREYRDALRIRPDDADLHHGLGLTLARARRFAEAIASYRAALRWRPADAATHRDLASALAGAGDLPAAIAEYQEALRLQPGDAPTHNGLAIAYARAGQDEAAANEFASALRLDPNYAEAHNNYGTLLASQGLLEGALAHYEEAVRLRPDYAEARANLDRARRQAAALRQ
jgi:tetratricopeptide (TPR) repeat protein